jgi:uncharacterized protein
MGTDAARVTRLARFPVKACGAEPLEEALVTGSGLAGDRVLAVVVGDRVATQREHPVLATVRPVLEDGSGRLSLSIARAACSACAGGPLEGPARGVVRRDGPAETVALFRDRVDVVDQEPALSEWFSRLLGRPARLVALPAGDRLGAPGEGRPGLFDEGAVSLHSEASLRELNRQIAERDLPGLPADRFRANIVIDGCGPHEEDRAQCFDLGQVALRHEGGDVRCAVTTVDQSAGRRAGPEPLRTLAGYRRAASGGVLFGVYASVARAGRVRVGDPVTLTGS